MSDKNVQYFSHFLFHIAYVAELMADIAEYDSNTTPPAREPSPPPLTSGHVYPPREVIIQQQRSRFATNQE